MWKNAIVATVTLLFGLVHVSLWRSSISWLPYKTVLLAPVRLA